MATMDLEMPQREPQRPLELYAACVAKADSAKIVQTTSTVIMATGLANLRVRSNRGVPIR